MSTLAIILFVALPLALVVFAAGVWVGMWLAGLFYDAPFVAEDWQAEEGCRFADSLSRGTFNAH